MYKHTAGEWELVKDTQASWIIKANGRIIATVWSLEDGKDNIARAQEAQANARLIAAAPELLEAANRLIASLPRGVEGLSRETSNAVGFLMNAIAKAEGRHV